MSKSISVVLRNVNQSGIGSLTVQVIENRKVSKKGLGIRLSQKDFDTYFDSIKNRFRKNERFENYSTYNDKIEVELKRLGTYDYDLSSIPDSRKSFITYWTTEINYQSNYGTKQKHQTILTKLKRFLESIEKSDLLFSEINIDFIKRFDVFLKTVRSPKVLTTNTATHYQKVIKSVVNKAIEESVYSYPKNPFETIRFKREETELKDVLTNDELKLLIDGELDKPALDICRNMFLFQTFNNGMRVSDLLLMRWLNLKTDRIVYKMFKTKRSISNPLNTNLIIILSKILGCYGKFNEFSSQMEIDYKKSDGMFSKINLIKLDELIEYGIYKEKTDEDIEITGRFSGLANYLKENDEFDKNTGVVITYKGYQIKDFDTQTKEYIDLRETLLNRVDKSFSNYVLDKIRKQKQDQFIFPMLDNTLFSKTDTITEEQYNQIKHCTIVYNRKLKKVSDSLGIKTNLTTHVSRHTFTNFLLSMGVNIYDISETLGHQTLTTTQKYVRTGFSSEKTDYLNKDLSDKYRMK